MVSVMRLILAVTLAFVLQLFAIPASSADNSELSSAGKIGLEQISTCLRSNPNLVVLLVVDESRSLQAYDPENKRADILADLVLSLGQLSGQPTAQGSRRVEFAVNTFAFGSSELIPWTTLTEQSAIEISNDLRAELPSLNDGTATDYEAALTVARSSMAQGVNGIGGKKQPCQVIFWFTDGILEISNDPSVNAASGERLCAPEGPVDALRFSGIHLISVLLMDNARLGDPNTAEGAQLRRGIALLQATAEGVGSSGQYQATCGRQPIPADAARGAFFEGNVDALAGQFTQALALGSGGTDVSSLKGTPVSFTIDPGLTRFWVTALAPGGFELTSPQGETLRGDPGADGGPIAGVEAEVTWTGATFIAKIPLTPSGFGEWTLSRAGMEDQVNVYLFGDYTLDVNVSEFVADENASITGSVLGPDGNAADLSVFESADLSVTQTVDGEVVDPVAFDLSIQDGAFSGTFVPKSNSTEIQFDLTLQLTTASGTQLAPITTSFVQQVKLPGGYPQITEAALDLGSVKNRGDIASSTLNVTGSVDGQTEVCVRGITPFTVVQGADLTLSTSADGNCIQLAANETASIDVSALLGSGVADGGQVRGELVLSVKNAPSADLPESREREWTVPFSVQVLPVDPLLWVPIALTILGVVLPLAALYFLNWRAARLKLEGLMVARVPVLVNLSSDQPLKRADDKAAGLLSHEDFVHAPVANDRARKWQSGGSEVLRGRAPGSPFGSVRAQVDAAPGFRVMSNEVPTTTRKGTSAGIGLNPSMSAYVLIPDTELSAADGDWVTGELVSYLVPANLAQDSARLAAQLTSYLGWSPAARELREVVMGSTPMAANVSAAVPASMEFPEPSDPSQPPEPPTGGSGKNKFSLD